MRHLLCTLALLSGCVTTATVDSPPDPEPVDDTVEYRAINMAMALDRLAIHRVDLATNTCAVLWFVHPQMQGEDDVQTPENWSLERGWLTATEDCEQAQGGAELTGAAGRLDWTQNDWEMPLLIDLDVQATYGDGQRINFVAEGLSTEP